MIFEMVAATIAASSAPAASAQDLSWIAGYWLSCGDGSEISETWSDPRASVMLGMSLTLRRGRASWEFSRIGPSATGISFFAQPSGQAPAEFPATEIGPEHVVFENPGHDFPQRVIYRRSNNRLSARIEGTIDGKFNASDWHYERADLNARCPGVVSQG